MATYTDHEALKSLMNTPHPSGKLARWGLALQEVDLHIHYRPGRKNANADALSRCHTEPQNHPFGIIAALQTEIQAKGGEECLREKQLADKQLAEVIQYPEHEVLPEDEKKARELTAMQSQFVMKDGVLFHIESDKTLRVVLPSPLREPLFNSLHSGKFGGHLRESKMHSEISRQYWWPKMRTDIAKWCKACLVCATRRPGRAVKPLLTPIPVSGAFDRVGVDVIKFPKSARGNQYAVVFVDYLTK